MWSIRYLSTFYHRGHPVQMPPEIRLMPCGGFGAGTISEQLSGRGVSAVPGYENTLNAFFSRGDLAQATQEGLFARPALSSVLVAETVLGMISEPILAKARRIFVV